MGVILVCSSDSSHPPSCTTDHLAEPVKFFRGPAWRLRQPRVFPRVGFPFLALGGVKLLRLFAHVIEQRRVARELLDAGLPVQFGVEAALEQSNRERAFLHDLAGPL